MKIRDIRNRFTQENPLAQINLQKDLGYQIGKRIELARGLKGMTQASLAQKLNTKQSSISRIESGSTLPSISFLMKIAEAFETFLTPPEFAFMRNHAQNEISYKSESSSNNDIPSPYITAFSSSDKSYGEFKNIKLVI